MSVRIFAPAKINLTLEVGRPRADGLHPLQSVVVFADVGDIVEAAPAETITLNVGGEFADKLVKDESNLVFRAARLLAAHAGVTQGAALSLEKSLPIASGIGGGSADAAATLRALDELWALNLGADELAKIGAALGSDVPVCLKGAPSYMTGIGGHLAPVSVPSLPAVLVNPLVPLATADVYRAFDHAGAGAVLETRPAPAWQNAGDAIAGVAALGNHLERPARSLVRQIDEILDVLRGDERVEVAAMSGSGATVFAIVANMDAATNLADDLQTRHSDWWVADTLLAGA